MMKKKGGNDANLALLEQKRKQIRNFFIPVTGLDCSYGEISTELGYRDASWTNRDIGNRASLCTAAPSPQEKSEGRGRLYTGHNRASPPSHINTVANFTKERGARRGLR